MVHDRQIEKVYLYRESNLMWNNGCTKDDLTPSLLAEGRRRTPAQRVVSHKRLHSQVLRHLRVLRRRARVAVLCKILAVPTSIRASASARAEAAQLWLCCAKCRLFPQAFVPWYLRGRMKTKWQ